jgi:hypothetical protein
MKQKSSFVMGLIGALLIVGFFAVLFALILAAFQKITLDGTVRDVLLVMLGTLGTMTTMVVSYYFGSSRGSQMKDEAISNMSRPPPPDADAQNQFVRNRVERVQ